ncbi:MAG TPA: single-stranded DNA-binding protein [Chloroflexia bacterium]|nr:single-stranded DNA-binding protein [Chloroflexia bacterium]
MAGRGLNKVMIIGNLGKDPDMKYTPSGKAITTFSVAVGRTSRAQDGTQTEETEWFRVVAWDKLAETCSQYLHKGSKVYIEGRLQTRKWTDNNGQEQKMVEIVANEMMMLDTRQGGSMGGEQRSGQPAAAAMDADMGDDEIPF